MYLLKFGEFVGLPKVKAERSLANAWTEASI